MPEVGDVKASTSDATYKPRNCYNAKGREKVKYITRKEAKQTLKAMPKLVNGVNMRSKSCVYKCERCGYFHIGHNR